MLVVEQLPEVSPPEIVSVGGKRRRRKRVVLYLRVSTDDQSYDGQGRDLRLYAEGRGWEVVGIYQEVVSATGKVERARFKQLLSNAREPNRRFDSVLVWSLDRWSRAERFTQAVEAIWELEALGVSFHSYREPGLDTPEDGAPDLGRDVLRALLPVIASYESRRRSERVRVAMREIIEGRRATNSGLPVGRPRVVTPSKLALIGTLKREGLSWGEIAQRASLKAETCRKAYRDAVRLAGGGDKASAGDSPTAASCDPPGEEGKPCPPHSCFLESAQTDGGDEGGAK